MPRQLKQPVCLPSTTRVFSWCRLSHYPTVANGPAIGQVYKSQFPGFPTPNNPCNRSLLVVYSSGSLCPASHSAAAKAERVAS